MRGCAAFEPFDDDHATAAAGAGMLWFFRLGRMGVDCFDGIDGDDWGPKQFASAGEVLGALAGREEAIVDPMQARRTESATVSVSFTTSA